MRPLRIGTGPNVRLPALSCTHIVWWVKSTHTIRTYPRGHDCGGDDAASAAGANANTNAPATEAETSA
ncbi:hypothetical protein GCM10023205_46890 [Yinghuangia aomiensis]|uniref:Uncharacterized protein n=1 Tax=Yinghuangia aomiensis TaxID=676205 RepID=A0ABP9HNS8_9ACTN